VFEKPEDLRDFERFFPEGSKSELSKYLTKDIWEEYKEVKCNGGVSFKECVFSGIKNLDSGIGLYAGSHDSYSKFNKLFDQVILNYHQHPPGALHTSDMSCGGIVNAQVSVQDSEMVL
jgi:creatine kinase/arginine kinase